MNNIDKRNIFADEIFTYEVRKDNKVFIFWHGKQVMVIKGKQAQKFLRRVAGLDERSAQLVMAKLTGNFKRGNER